MHLLANGKRRRREIDYRLSSRGHQLLYGIGVIAAAPAEIAVVPDILADGDPEDRSPQL
jgi:hypothetical protein